MPYDVTRNGYLNRRSIEPMPDPHRTNLPSHDARDDRREPGVWIVLIVAMVLCGAFLIGAALGLSGGMP